ncbi:DNA independent RNA polymerase I transcription factor [Microbotryomycetes sp. JL221]|nr:DNA independent RNA polymerase I transcription factor [Microbotryomycetes sp. JL221]
MVNTATTSSHHHQHNPPPLVKHQSSGALPRPVKRTKLPPQPHSSTTMTSRTAKRPRSAVDGAATTTHEDVMPSLLRRAESAKTTSRTMKPLPSPTRANSTEGAAFKKRMFLQFIEDAFTQKARGNNEHYTQLIGQFRSLLPSSAAASGQQSTPSDAPQAPTSSQLRIWLEALTHVVSQLDEKYVTLVDTILAVPWATMDDVFVNAYLRFVGALVSARAEWLKSVLDKCARGFRYRSPYTAGSPAAMPSITRRILYGRLHSLLRTLLALIPTLSTSLSPLLIQHFPSKREHKTAQICYINNLLAVTEYCPALTEDVLALIIERALNIDVEIQGEPEEWEEVEDEILAENGGKEPDAVDIKALVDRPTAEDGDSDLSDDENDDDDDDGENGLEDTLDSSDDEPEPIGDEEAALKARQDQRMSEVAIRKILDNRSRLDAILKVVFEHINTVYNLRPSSAASSVMNGSREATPTPDQHSSVVAVERRTTLFRSLLDIFDRVLLRTFRTRNTQFLLFYLASLDDASSDHFIGVLLTRALYEHDAVAITRVAAAGYVASFIARAKFVDQAMTRKVVTHLCRFLESQMDELAMYSGKPGTAGGSELPVFYAVAQAVFYIFCFRHHDLMDEPDEDEQLVVDEGRRWMLGLETLKRAVSSPFNPLKVCAQPIVGQFAAIAQRTSFMYCYHIMDANRRSSVRESVTMPPPSNSTHAPLPPSRADSNGEGISSTPRQLLVAEEMDSFFPFDPFKLPLCSQYIDEIYREWVPDDDSSMTGSSTDDTSSDDDDDDDGDTTRDDTFGSNMQGLTVPGLNANASGSSEAEDDEVARSFEAMSLSLSPAHESFGGRRNTKQQQHMNPIPDLSP